MAGELTALLAVRPGVTAVIGGGGKTTLLRTLARELQGRVILCTTTRIYPFSEYPTGDFDAAALTQMLTASPVVCVGAPAQQGKLQAPTLPISRLAELADYVLVEADGAKGLPLKAHAAWEPVIPAECENVILVAGLSGLGQPIARACHRPERYAALTACDQDSLVTPALAATVIEKENLHHRVLLNQLDVLPDLAPAKELASCLTCPVAAGSLQKEWYLCLR